jgi:hypothetical protein
VGREGFEKLHVYRLAEQLGDEVWGIVVKWAPIARSTVGLQMILKSIGKTSARHSGQSPRDK